MSEAPVNSEIQPGCDAINNEIAIQAPEYNSEEMSPSEIEGMNLRESHPKG
jgi:hypothetical protein